MDFYRLEGRLDLLPETIWGGSDRTLFLPACSEPAVEADPLFWIVDKGGRKIPLAWSGGAALDLDDALLQMRNQAALVSPRPLMSYTPFHPHRLPSFARVWMRRILALACRLPKRNTVFPRWPIEPSLEVLKAIVRIAGLNGDTPFWPDRADFALCLSHDVDTAMGQKNVLTLAEIEEDLGLRSAWFLTPANYDLDAGLWQEMAARGHEIACHGLRHDFKLAYLSPARTAGRLDRARELLASFEVAGFRSPGFLRTPSLLEAVASRFLYDSSIPDTLVLHGASGCASVFPFKLRSLVEVPVTLPYDGEMMALGMGPEEREMLWKRKAAWIRKAGGLVHLLTHPDPGFTDCTRERELYRRLLERLLGDRPWSALPRDIRI